MWKTGKAVCANISRTSIIRNGFNNAAPLQKHTHTRYSEQKSFALQIAILKFRKTVPSPNRHNLL